MFRPIFACCALFLVAALFWGCAAHEKGSVKKALPKKRVVVKKAEEMPMIPPEAVAGLPLNATASKAGSFRPYYQEANATPSVTGKQVGENATVCALRTLDDLRRFSEERSLEDELNAQMAYMERMPGEFHRFLLQMERPEVDGFVEDYLGNDSKRPRLMRHLKRASALVEVAKRVLRDEGMPTALAYLPIIESGYQSSIRSRSHAVGYWQFVASTARKYGLRIDRWVDERRDIERSTRAAARYFRDLYGMFGSWELALAAYNGGEGRVFRSLERGGVGDFWSLRESGALRRESSDYVPRFLAVLKILVYASDYGVPPVEGGDPLMFYKAGVPGGVALSTVAQWSGISERVLKRLNPAVLRWRVPPFVQGYVLRFPSRRAVALLERNLNRYSMRRSARHRRRMIRHRVKRGETLSDIAARYRVSVSAIMSYNGITDPRRIRPGRVIYIPPRGRRGPRS